jgi:hypothetical protein
MIADYYGDATATDIDCAIAATASTITISWVDLSDIKEALRDTRDPWECDHWYAPRKIRPNKVFCIPKKIFKPRTVMSRRQKYKQKRKKWLHRPTRY